MGRELFQILENRTAISGRGFRGAGRIGIENASQVG
jgi:hypothetical protein